MRDVRWCAHIHSHLQVMAKFHLLDGTKLWIATPDKRTTNGNRVAGIVSLHFTLLQLRQN